MKERRVKWSYAEVGTSWRWKDEQKGWELVNMVNDLVYLYKNRTMTPIEVILRRR
jgi:hypothetical protein